VVEFVRWAGSAEAKKIAERLGFLVVEEVAR
jgi:hypothetical protein